VRKATGRRSSTRRPRADEERDAEPRIADARPMMASDAAPRRSTDGRPCLQPPMRKDDSLTTRERRWPRRMSRPMTMTGSGDRAIRGSGEADEDRALAGLLFSTARGSLVAIHELQHAFGFE